MPTTAGSEVTYNAQFAFKGVAQLAVPVVAVYLPFLATKVVDQLQRCLDRLSAHEAERGSGHRRGVRGRRCVTMSDSARPKTDSSVGASPEADRLTARPRRDHPPT